MRSASESDINHYEGLMANNGYTQLHIQQSIPSVAEYLNNPAAPSCSVAAPGSDRARIEPPASTGCLTAVGHQHDLRRRFGIDFGQGKDHAIIAAALTSRYLASIFPPSSLPSGAWTSLRSLAMSTPS
jgi:hypothetical protein